MKISALKDYLKGRKELTIKLPDGQLVPNHFHVTEVGETNNHFIDCGGTVRHEKVATFQLWSADDFDHRLEGEKLNQIIAIAESELGLGNLDIEVEYQGQNTIEKYGLEIEDGSLRLTGQLTDCLARDKCGIPAKMEFSIDTMATKSGACQPGSGCC